MVVSSRYRNPRSFRSLVDRPIFLLTIAQFPARAPLIEMIANPAHPTPESITPFVTLSPPDQLRVLIHLERFFNRFVTTFLSNQKASPHISSGRPDAPRSP
jgi:hypothetical protein